RLKPQYESASVDEFIYIRDFRATGDGTTDDTAAQGKILFVDAGSYLLTSTVTVPTGSRIVGETWSQLVATGPYFQDANNPKVLLRCPALTSGVNQGYNAASLMMHITPSASGYFENMWLWVSDYDIELYGTSSEHAVYYQYNFHKARNVFASMIQTESPYFQPTPPPPAPFTDAVGVLPGDPDYTYTPGDEFSGCDQSVDSYPFWSQVSVLDISSTGAQFNDLAWIDPAIWDMEQPAFTCSAPCYVKIPPWKGATSTVNYPLLTVSDGTWTSTIIKLPLTISEWMFEEVTLT
ncbi:pectin lyase fold/virulence factor, partial [Staphylotrichum tortipilum]